MVVPYGEALIHSWYWEGFSNLTGTEFIEAVGAQTNLSFSIETSLRIYREAGGQTDKLRLWATFHPEMISVEEFIENRLQESYEKIQQDMIIKKSIISIFNYFKR